MTKLESPLTQADAMLVLNGLPGIGPVTTRRLLDSFDADPLAILQAPQKELMRTVGVGHELAEVIVRWRTHFDLKRERERLKRHGFRFVDKCAEFYPPLLRELYDAPLGLYQKGPHGMDERCVAIVGTRHASLYGMKVAKQLASELSGAGWCVVSGLARGIDTAAHEGALLAGGKTAAVLGCGPDIIYPPENIDLYQQISETGCLLTEFKFGTRASRTTFPMRNRLVSGMCRAVIVVESAISGGSLITAKFAAEQGRDVYAIPGRIDQAHSAGCHQLIRDGATLLTHADELLSELEQRTHVQTDMFAESGHSVPSVNWQDGLSETEIKLLTPLVEQGPLPLDAIAEQVDEDTATVSATLVMLELKARLIKRADGCFEAH